MHPKRRGQTKELTRLLLELIAAGVITSVAAGLSHNPRRTGRAFEALIGFSRKRMRQALGRLKMQGMIRYDERDIASPLFVTPRGLARRNTNRLKSMQKIMVPRRWDYLWRIVFFDIKESRRWIRDQFREHLCELGFYPLQRSVYVIPYECSREINELTALLFIRHQAILCVTPTLGRFETRVRAYFLKQEDVPKNLE